MSNQPVLKVSGLRKVFKIRAGDSRQTEDLVAVDDVSFDLPSSGSLGIVGESGSGKTTVARIIARLERATGGTAAIAGTELSARRPRGRGRRAQGRQVQMVFQDPYSSLDPRQTVRACLEEVLRLHATADKTGRRGRALELLHQAGSIWSAAHRRCDRLNCALDGRFCGRLRHRRHAVGLVVDEQNRVVPGLARRAGRAGSAAGTPKTSAIHASVVTS